MYILSTYSLVINLPPQCSKICDGGVKYRKVRCQQLLALGEIADKPAKLCPKHSPDTERPCNPQPCSSYDYEKKAFDLVRNDEADGCVISSIFGPNVLKFVIIKV